MATPLPCEYYTNAGYDVRTWETRCTSVGGQAVPCSDLANGFLSIGAYYRAKYSPDGQFTCYDRTVIDVGEDVVEGVQGEIEDSYRTITDNWVFYTIAAVSVAALVGSIWLLTREILKG